MRECFANISQTFFGKLRQTPLTFGIGEIFFKLFMGLKTRKDTRKFERNSLIFIVSILRSDRDSNSGYPFGVYTLSRSSASVHKQHNITKLIVLFFCSQTFRKHFTCAKIRKNLDKSISFLIAFEIFACSQYHFRGANLEADRFHLLIRTSLFGFFPTLQTEPLSYLASRTFLKMLPRLLASHP